MAEALLQITGLEKTFPGVRALKGVQLTVNKGEVHSLMGENGAGKSTLIKVLTGIYQKNGGTIIFDGKEIDCKTPIEANEVGIILNEDFDIAVRTGYHCAPYIHQFLETVECKGTVRVSLGYFNTEDDVDALVGAVKDIVRG